MAFGRTKTETKSELKFSVDIKDSIEYAERLQERDALQHEKTGIEREQLAANDAPAERYDAWVTAAAAGETTATLTSLQTLRDQHAVISRRLVTAEDELEAARLKVAVVVAAEANQIQAERWRKMMDLQRATFEALDDFLAVRPAAIRAAGGDLSMITLIPPPISAQHRTQILAYDEYITRENLL
jgi:hypothetical protein